eukprot:Pgem_evm1s7793
MLLTEESREALVDQIKMIERAQQLEMFFKHSAELLAEMKWRHKIQSIKILSFFSETLRLWNNLSFTLAVLLNLVLLSGGFD